MRALPEGLPSITNHIIGRYVLNGPVGCRFNGHAGVRSNCGVHTRHMSYGALSQTETGNERRAIMYRDSNT
jgi:hypothetical protein